MHGGANIPVWVQYSTTGCGCHYSNLLMFHRRYSYSDVGSKLQVWRPCCAARTWHKIFISFCDHGEIFQKCAHVHSKISCFFFGLIAEVILYSEGYESDYYLNTVLKQCCSRKLVSYKTC